VSILFENTSAKLSALLDRPASGKLITAEHRKVIGQICTEAKADGMSIEQLIVSLKSIFEKLPLSDDALQSRAEIRERLIAVCIEEYYRDGKGVPSRDGKGAVSGDGKGAISGDGKGVASGDGTSAPFPAQKKSADG
jgi:hypothetical protein